MDGKANNPILVTTASLITLVIVGWLMIVGQSLIVPIVIAVILVYVVTAASEWLGRTIPALQSRPRVRSFLLMASVIVLIMAFINFFVENTQTIAQALPGYSQNLNQIIADVSVQFGVSEVPTLSSMVDIMRERLDFAALFQQAIGVISSLGSVVLLAVCYAIFLFADIKSMPQKLLLAVESEDSARDLTNIVLKTNKRVGDYLIAKTTVNVVLGAISLAIMLLLGVEFALLWAVLIGLFNYIPYIGSIIGVLFPVLLSLAQFGSVGAAIVALVGLMCAQLFAAYVLEPRMLGKSVNLSPFMVLVSLAFWTTLWGTVGAILAVPLTAVAIIVMAQISVTRPAAVMLSADGNV